MWAPLLKAGKKGTILCGGRTMNKTATWGNLEKENLLGKLRDRAKNISRQTGENNQLASF